MVCTQFPEMFIIKKLWPEIMGLINNNDRWTMNASSETSTIFIAFFPSSNFCKTMHKIFLIAIISKSLNENE